MNLELNFEKSYISKKNIMLVFNILNTTEEVKNSDVNSVLTDIEKKYFTQVSLNNKKVVFKFEIDKWFDNNIKQTLIDTPDRFEKKIKIGKIPSMVSANINQVTYTDYIEQSFRNYIEKNKKLKKKILSIVKFEKPSLSYFKYSYDFDSILISLKEEFRLNPSLFVNFDNKEKKIDFDKMVKSYLNNA